MQYLVSVIADGTESPSPGEGAAIDLFNDRLTAEIEWLRGLTQALPEIIADETARRYDVNHPANQSAARPRSGPTQT